MFFFRLGLNTPYLPVIIYCSYRTKKSDYTTSLNNTIVSFPLFRLYFDCPKPTKPSWT